MALYKCVYYYYYYYKVVVLYVKCGLISQSKDHWWKREAKEQMVMYEGVLQNLYEGIIDIYIYTVFECVIRVTCIVSLYH